MLRMVHLLLLECWSLRLLMKWPPRLFSPLEAAAVARSGPGWLAWWLEAPAASSSRGCPWWPGCPSPPACSWSRPPSHPWSLGSCRRTWYKIMKNIINYSNRWRWKNGNRRMILLFIKNMISFELKLQYYKIIKKITNIFFLNYWVINCMVFKTFHTSVKCLYNLVNPQWSTS